MSRWTLTVIFDEPKDQETTDPELFFPNDESTKFITFLTRTWGLMPEELMMADVSFTGTRIVVHFDSLDYIQNPLRNLLMSAIPQSITLTRNEAR